MEHDATVTQVYWLQVTRSANARGLLSTPVVEEKVNSSRQLGKMKVTILPSVFTDPLLQLVHTCSDPPQLNPAPHSHDPATLPVWEPWQPPPSLSKPDSSNPSRPRLNLLGLLPSTAQQNCFPEALIILSSQAHSPPSGPQCLPPLLLRPELRPEPAQALSPSLCLLCGSSPSVVPQELHGPSSCPLSGGPFILCVRVTPVVAAPPSLTVRDPLLAEGLAQQDVSRVTGA